MASALGSRLSALGSRLSALGSRLSALGSRLSALGSRLSALGSRLSALGSRLSALGSRLSALGSRLSALGSRLSALGSRLSALGSRLSALDDTGEDFQKCQDLGRTVHYASQRPPILSSAASFSCSPLGRYGAARRPPCRPTAVDRRADALVDRTALYAKARLVCESVIWKESNTPGASAARQMTGGKGKRAKKSEGPLSAEAQGTRKATAPDAPGPPAATGRAC